MGRPRKPTVVLVAKGAFKKNPNRKRTDPAAQGLIGRAPRHLSKSLQSIWREVSKRTAPGVLTSADRIALEEVCSLVYQRRMNFRGMSTSLRNLLRSYLVSFGMTPVARARIHIPPQQQDKIFDDF